MKSRSRITTEIATKSRRGDLESIHPGEILREEFMRPLGVSFNRLARDVSVPPNRVSAIVNGTRAISADTALRLGKFFGVSPEMWTGLQAEYDLRIARRTSWRKAEPRVMVLAEAPARYGRRAC